jgi:excisionase family DNA binding protein
VRFRGSDGKTVTAPVTTKGKNAGKSCRVVSPTWYGRVNGEPVPLCTDKTAAELMLAELIRKALLADRGITDPFEEHKARPLAEHLADFRTALTAKGNTLDYVALVLGRLQALVNGCGWRTLCDLSASQAGEWLTRQHTPGRPAPALPPGRDAFTPAETAKLLGVSTAAVRDAVKRHRLPAAGAGKARRFPRATVLALLDRQGRGAGAQTRNSYRARLRTFGNWLVRDRRLGENPFRHVEAENTATDRRHDRRELDAGELRRVLETARGSARPFRGLTGPDRFHLYATACGTGFRASALASLTPESFDLAAGVPTVTLAARHAKNRKTKVQPVPPDLAELLRDYLRGRPPGRHVWGGTWAKDHRGAEMLRADLEAAGIPYVVEGPDGPLFADFHSLRHSHLTLGGRAGIDLRTLQELAGHSTPVLTARYSHRRLHDLAGAVEKLPRLLPDEAPAAERAALRATGTDAAAPGSADKSTPRPPGAYTLLTHDPDSGGDSGRVPETQAGGEGEKATGRKPLLLQGVAAGSDSRRLPEISEGDGTRTRNHRIDRQHKSPAFGLRNPFTINTLHPPRGVCKVSRTSAETRENRTVFRRCAEVRGRTPPSLAVGPGGAGCLRQGADRCAVRRTHDHFREPGR